MSGAMDIGAVALRAQQSALDAIANNVANVNTPTYKRVDADFSTILAQQLPAISETERLAAGDFLASGGVRFAPHEMILSQGEIRVTGNRLDLAIEGAGFIELMGPDGQPLLWRGGRLKVLDDGQLASDSGHALRAGIFIPDDATNLDITADGIVRADLPEAEGVELGQIALVLVSSDQDLERLDGGLYRAVESARVIDSRPGEDGAGTIAQGRIEGSNVELTEEMVSLLTVQRAFAASAQILQAADQLAGITKPQAVVSPMIAPLFLQTAVLAVAPVPGTPPPLAIDGNYLLLRHLVAPGDIPPDVDAKMRLLEVPAGARHIELTREVQEKLLRRRLPTLHLAPQSAGTIRLVFTPGVPHEATGRCFELRRSLPADSWVSLAEAEETPCDESRGAARLGYDRTARVPQTRTALAAGSYLGPIALPSKLPQPKGAALTLRTRVGPVTVDRTATLEQPGRAGRRAFVRLSDGRIIAASLADEGEKP